MCNENKKQTYSISEAAKFLCVGEYELLLIWKWDNIKMKFDDDIIPYFEHNELIRYKEVLIRYKEIMKTGDSEDE